MKEETLQGLLTAKVLFEKAEELCSVDNAYIASAGLVVLQDAVELVLCAGLIEIGVDEEKRVGELRFEELLSALQSKGKKVIKSGTLIAMHKQRNIIKHYGQLGEPCNIKKYNNITKLTVDALLQDIIGKTLGQVMIFDVLKDGESKEYLIKANDKIKSEKYHEALIDIRKAVYLEIEKEYSIEKCKDVDKDANSRMIAVLGASTKAPYYTTSKEWIEENVKDPTDYIQLDHNEVRKDLLEWGVSTQEFWNLWRLTPEVVRLKDDKWIVKEDLNKKAKLETKDNTAYCFNCAVNLIFKKQNHSNLARYISYEEYDHFVAIPKNNINYYQKASLQSKIKGTLEKGKRYRCMDIVQGFENDKKFIIILESFSIYGYVDYEECDIVKMQ